MAIHDRTYMRDESSKRGLGPPSFATWMVLFHAATMLAVRGAEVWGGRSVDGRFDDRFGSHVGSQLGAQLDFGVGQFRDGRWWTVVVHPFHDVFSVGWFFAMAGFWLAVRLLHEELGTRRTVVFLAGATLLACGVHAAAILAGASGRIAPDSVHGFSALTTAAFVHAILHDPRREIWVHLAGLPVWLIAASWLGIGVAIVFRFIEVDGVGLWSQLGAAGAGALAWRIGRAGGLRLPRLSGAQRRPAVSSAAEPPPPSRVERERVDALLDKIARDGMASLSAAEREFLERASKRY